MTTRVILAAVAATASLAVAACGAGDKPTSSSASSRNAAMRKSMLQFAQCMRQHGIDMPDPQFSGGRVEMGIGGKGGKIDQAKMRAAETACKHFQDQVKPAAMSDADKEKFRKMALANSRCMREHGIDMPDPTFDSNGGAQMRIGPGSGIDPNSAKFKAAQKACEKVSGMGGAMSTQSGGGK
jgi:hypothetical protein